MAFTQRTAGGAEKRQCFFKQRGGGLVVAQASAGESKFTVMVVVPF